MPNPVTKYDQEDTVKYGHTSLTSITEYPSKKHDQEDTITFSDKLHDVVPSYDVLGRYTESSQDVAPMMSSQIVTQNGDDFLCTAKFAGRSRNPFVTSCSSDVQDCGET